MMKKEIVVRKSSAAAIAATLMLGAAPALAASTFQVILQFNGQNGSIPVAPLTADSAGDLYGTTIYGGSSNSGVVFRLASDGTETVLYSFTGGNDGATPNGSVALDDAGNVYGETYAGGTAGYGTVFKIAPDGTETLLHTFVGGTKDGINPEGGLVRDRKGTLFGMAYAGGTNNFGVVYAIEPNGKFKILHSFASGSDGVYPTAGLVLDKTGNLYGTTLQGGSGNGGTVFKLAPDGTETVLYSFQNGFDGGLPSSPVVLDKAGNVYGGTTYGGTTYNGVIYKVTPSGQETVLYSFTGNADGGTPESGLTLDKKGNLYGTASEGGTVGNGVVFKLAPSGKETVLYSFPSNQGVDKPLAGLITDPATGKAYFYGTATGFDTIGGHGGVFKISK